MLWKIQTQDIPKQKNRVHKRSSNVKGIHKWLKTERNSSKTGEAKQTKNHTWTKRIRLNGSSDSLQLAPLFLSFFFSIFFILVFLSKSLLALPIHQSAAWLPSLTRLAAHVSCRLWSCPLFRKGVPPSYQKKKSSSRVVAAKICKEGSTQSQPRIEISVNTDISVLEFYGYIGNIGKISVDIFHQISVRQKLSKIDGNA